ncbi:NYN domain-containing protein [Brevibacterium jeotgali]|uniref:TIGR00288 family protein n=1 Tax=Brevibacterium jeotgali TaxID=1262550 RepID=A0A2H1L2I1_9MICO|nr:NYN domain-containing protein [Brevibacterium jeotgali]TWC02332.1 uncharacterized protein (TIGR00288 family) [Brevibacterium jeotgali]SMY11124.1 TIGR00288 family protein [Brevibacterium jeotgali]
MTPHSTPSHDDTRIAVLIDCDNVSPTHAGAVLEELASYGTPTIKRAYGDWTTSQLNGWKKELNRWAIQPVQQFAYTVGKNSTDSALIIDAMDLMWMGNVESFAIVSSDSDFTRLATRLRESGKKVIGLGRRKTPISLRNAVDQFIYLELLGGDDSDGETSKEVEAPAESAAPAPESPKPASEPAPAATVQTSVTFSDAVSNEPASRINLQSALTKAINATSGDDGWANLSLLGQHLSRTHADFDPRDFGHSKLSDLVSEQPYLDHRTDGRQMEARLKKRSGRKH